MESDLATQSEQCSLGGSCNVYKDQGKFLNAINGEFLSIVNPKEDGLLDELRAVGAISSEEEQEIDAKNTRRDKARQTWLIFHHIPARMLGEKCVPILEHIYPHVVRGKTFDWTEQSKLENKCLHHTIKKVVGLRRFADVLPASNSCSAAEYEKVLRAEDGNESWRRLFDILKQNSSSEILKKSVIGVLNNFGILPPEQFDRLLQSGFPCTCNHGYRKKHRTGALNTQQMLLRSLDETSSRTSYPISPMSDHQNDANSEICSDQPMDENSQPMSDEKPKTWETFDKQEDKHQYRITLGKIDKAITFASCIKLFFRELERIQDDILSLTMRARDEISDHLSEADMQGVTRLHGKAVRFHGKILRFYDAVKNVQKSVCDNQNLFSFCVPQYQNKVFLERKQMLHNEIQEASHFCNSSTKVMVEIDLCCRNCSKNM